MQQLPDDIKIKYMKKLEDLYKTKCVAQLYDKHPFTPRNKPFEPTNRTRVQMYNRMTHFPKMYGLQSHRQRTLLPVIAEGMARLPPERVLL